MTFEEVVEVLRGFVGRGVAVNITDERFGLANGYIADFSGILVRVDDPVEGVDAPVHYFRIDDNGGFGIHQVMLKSADWTTVGGRRDLRISLGEVVISVTPLRS